jgi:hypothetical protein
MKIYAASKIINSLVIRKLFLFTSLIGICFCGEHFNADIYHAIYKLFLINASRMAENEFS